MDNRREFIKKAAMLAGATGFAGVLPASIQKALAINPAPGTTWLDAEHVVILMQENRSFDHCYGSLQGVRGFSDPRAITLPDNSPVWLQTNEAGETYSPFRLDIKDTKATWMGSLPHSWTNQTDARNDGRHDRWLHAKRSGQKDYANMPLTLGYYDRRDLPFYYALADAFTLCDQNFCSCLTGTTPNRLYLWSATIRDEQHHSSRARVRNEDTDYDLPASWKTFPERLEEKGINWKIYQNEISLHPGFEGEEDAWLANFGDNPIEWFSQYHVRFSPGYMNHISEGIEDLTKKVVAIQEKNHALQPGSAEYVKNENTLAELHKHLRILEKDREVITPEQYEKLSSREKNLNAKAFTRNSKDADFHKLTTLSYKDGDTQRELNVPKGDVLHQFREDVHSGQLPTVSWMVAPENFSDHPSAPWYGAWYISEVMDILTQNPEVWKKTIFILCYDENDGYFDHVPPFVSPDPSRPATGKVSEGIDAGLEHVTLAQDKMRANEKEARSGPIGLGYRVPLLIASPWSRGGYINSQVCDHTSILQMLEKFISHRSGESIKETNMSAWRRAVCGDLSSVFRPYNGEKIMLPVFQEKNEVLEGIHKAKFKALPSAYQKLTTAQVEEVRKNPGASGLLPRQEKGARLSCALPYELHVNGQLNNDCTIFTITMKAGKTAFPETAAGSPFTIYVHGKEYRTANYAVVAGDQLTDDFKLEEFENSRYDLRVHGPNGFYRAFHGSSSNLLPVISVDYEPGLNMTPTGRIAIHVKGAKTGNKNSIFIVRDNSYKTPDKKMKVKDGKALVFIDPNPQGGWYDFSVLLEGNQTFEQRYAGRVETGKDSTTDPLIGM